MVDIKQYIIAAGTSVIDAMSIIDKGGKGIAFVCKDRNLVGSLSDGDIRRYILSGGDIMKAADDIAVKRCVHVGTDELDLAEKLLHQNKFRAIPVTDQDGMLCSIQFSDQIVAHYPSQLKLPVVIMAGGKGTRLYPYTKILPKPLIPINDIPITEHIMQQFYNFGCDDFAMIVNHQKEMIKAFFFELKGPYHVRFIDEELPLGTGGGLKLMEGMLDGPFFFTNCDTLIEADYEQIYRQHVRDKNIATIVCATQKVTIPYGTVSVKQDGQLLEMQEKPQYSFLINTGFYLLDSKIMGYIPENTFIHITEIIEKCCLAGERVGVFPISELQWSDMGQLAELRNMQKKKESEGLGG